MKKIALFILLLGTASILAQGLPPVSTGGIGGDLPEIPSFDDFDPPPMPDENNNSSMGGNDLLGNEMLPEIPSPSSSQPNNYSQQQPQAPQPQNNFQAQQQPPQNITVQPQASQEIGGAPVFDAATAFMSHFKFEAVFSSKPWSQYWYAPGVEMLRVSTLPQPIQAGRGAILSWQRDALGNPMVYLRAKANFPKLIRPDAVSQAQPLQNIPVEVAQAVVFYQRPGGWIASASPLYVTLHEESGKRLILVPVQEGKGVWRAWVGHGGLFVENFMGAGLNAARTELYRYFNEEEIRLFAQGNSDVVFYLRPQQGTFVNTSAKAGLTN